MQHGVVVQPFMGEAALPTGAGDQPTPFGVLFERELEQPADFLLGMLGRSGGQMAETSADENGVIPAGFTFLGQFIDHDITLMESPPSLGQPQDLNTVRNLRTPKLDLDSVFGKGPHDPDAQRFYEPGTLRLSLATGGRDIIRTDGGSRSKRIAEPRNDENHIIVQLHVLFMRMYNRLLEEQGGAASYEAARRATVLHYQHMVLTDYLPRIVGQDAVDAALARQASRYADMVRNFPIKLIMPLEFAFAAFRFGHTQLRDGYLLRDGSGRPLFADGNGADLNGSQAVTPQSEVDWDLFFEVSELNGGPPRAGRNLSRRFDTRLATSLHRLRPPAIGDLPVSLAERNLRRGRAFSLPSGQKVARALGMSQLSAADLAIDGAVIRAQAELGGGSQAVDIRTHTPLWYYMLKESELAGGERLRGVGAWIVAETFVGLLKHDADSILNLPEAFVPDPRFATMAAIAANA